MPDCGLSTTGLEVRTSEIRLSDMLVVTALRSRQEGPSNGPAEVVDYCYSGTTELDLFLLGEVKQGIQGGLHYGIGKGFVPPSPLGNPL